MSNNGTIREQAFSPREFFPRLWKNYLQVRRLEMTLEEFQAYWRMNYEELAIICETSVGTVQHWFVKGKSYRQPEIHHRRRLAQTHKDLLQMKLQVSNRFFR